MTRLVTPLSGDQVRAGAQDVIEHARQNGTAPASLRSLVGCRPQIYLSGIDAPKGSPSWGTGRGQFW